MFYLEGLTLEQQSAFAARLSCPHGNAGDGGRAGWDVALRDVAWRSVIPFVMIWRKQRFLILAWEYREDLQCLLSGLGLTKMAGLMGHSITPKRGFPPQTLA